MIHCASRLNVNTTHWNGSFMPPPFTHLPFVRRRPLKVGYKVQLSTGGPVMIVERVTLDDLPAGLDATLEDLDARGVVEAHGYYPTDPDRLLKRAHAAFVEPQVMVWAEKQQSDDYTP